jgi:hypothetical protein
MRKQLALALALLFVSVTIFAQEHQHADKKPPAMDPAMMEAMMKAALPGPAHKMLDSMVGSWDTKVMSWMAPGTEPMGGIGTSENKWILGGRFVEQRFKGDFMGMPFEGLGYTGYDNVKKQYFGTWMDNMGTGMMTSVATGGDAKTMTFKGTYADPMTGKDTTIEEKVTWVDADHHNFEMWSPGADGTMFKSMEIQYTRKH